MLEKVIVKNKRQKMHGSGNPYSPYQAKQEASGWGSHPIQDIQAGIKQEGSNAWG
jgi:hypothetical protein